MLKDTPITTVIRIALLLGLLVWCFLIVKPFLAIILWAVILGVTMFPFYDKLTGGPEVKRKKMISVIFTLFIIAVFIVPTYFIISSLAKSSMAFAEEIRADTFEIPPPDEKVKDWALIGEPLYENWSQLNQDVTTYVLEHKELFLERGRKFINRLTNLLGTLAGFVLSFLIAVILMYRAEAGRRSADEFFTTLMGETGPEIADMSRDTIRSVVKGILLIACIQSGLAFLGFAIFGLPVPGVFAVLVLMAAIVQLPVILVMIPAIILAFSMGPTTPAIIFTVYCVLVGLIDNVIKPMMMGKGLQTPMIVLLIGTIGGMLLHGIIGIFIGAVVLAVGHRFYTHWVGAQTAVEKA